MARRAPRPAAEAAAKPPNASDNDGLSRFADRLERLETERREAAAAFAAVLAEAEDAGHHKKALRAIVKRRLESFEQQAARLATEEAFDRMLVRLGMLSDMPLGKAALAAAAGEHARG